jgi:hypothetical protein
MKRSLASLLHPFPEDSPALGDLFLAVVDIVSFGDVSVPLTDLDTFRSSLVDCILERACDDSEAGGQGLGFVVDKPSAPQVKDDELAAWACVDSLGGFVLHCETLVPPLPGVNVLFDPSLRISGGVVEFNVGVGLRAEYDKFISGLEQFTYWDVITLSRLLTGKNKPSPPRWRIRTESFAAFVRRSVAFYKTFRLLPQPSK